MENLFLEYAALEDIVFSVVCAVIALLVIVLDWILLSIQERSLLDISYGSRNPWLILMGWAIASGIVGLFTKSLGIVQANLQGAIAVAISWPILFARIVEITGEGVEGGTPIQTPTGEDVE